MRKLLLPVVAIVILISSLLISSCIPPTPAPALPPKAIVFTLTSTEIVDRGIIPDKYTFALGKNISPPLSWANVPEGTKSFALTLVDPDVPWGRFGLPGPGFLLGDLFVHWVIYDIPAEVTSLEEGISPKGKLPEGAKELQNDGRYFKGTPFYEKRFGYIGMAPPAGDKAHGYVFTLYAFSVEELGLSPEATYSDFIDAIKGKVVARSSLIAYFGVKKE